MSESTRKPSNVINKWGSNYGSRKSYRNYIIIKKSFEDALQEGIKRANQTLKNVKGAWVQEQKVIVDNGKIKEYRVNMKISFILED